MDIIRRFFVSLILGASLLIPSSALAKDSFFDVFPELTPVETPAPSIDSFFDIFAEVEMPDAKCDKCKAIEEEIKLVEEEIASVEAELSFYDMWMSLAESAIADTEATLKKLQAQLEEMRNPKSYVESEGRRYDSSDHAAMERRNANLWKSYKGGRLTAQEYSDEIGKPFDDPEVQADLKILKAIIEDELQDQIDEQEDLLQKVKDARDEMNETGAELMAELEMLEEELMTLREQLEDCNERCTEEDLNIPEEYNIMPDDRSFWDWVIDFFNGPDEEESPFAGLDEILEELNKDMAGGGGGETPPEIDDAGLGGEPFTLPEGLFDFLDDLELPPTTCHLCDPIRAEIEQLQNSINEMENRQAQLDAQVDAAYRDLDTARNAKNRAERALEELDNPRSSAESEGRRIDSNDQAAMKVRNQRLWGAYKSGDLSAQELSDEWGKPFDDPAVKAELDAIKAEMRADLTQAINDAQAAMDKINADITTMNEELIDLAGKIAGHKVLLDFHLRDLEECEKRCRAVQDDHTENVIPGFEDFIFPGDEHDDEDMTDEPEETEEVGWFDGFKEWVDGLFDGEDEPEEKTPEEAAEENIKVPQECVSPAVPMSQCSQGCHTQCTKSGVRAWQEGNTVYIEDCGICPPMELDLCPTGTYFEKSQCESDNKCTCEEKAKSTKGEPCYACKASTGTETSSVSSRTTTGGQSTVSSRSSVSSKAESKASSVSSRTTTGGQSTVSSKSSSSKSSVATTPSCPNGTTSNLDTCESQCESQGGSCVGEDGCYSCVITNCPAGTYKNECPTSCSGGCDVAAEEGNTTCYSCKQSCEDVCAQNGYGGPNTDHSNAILSQLQGYSCVSGASVSIQTATIGSCQCIGEFSLSVNQTPPVCQGTPCGDVVCGGSASCPGGPNETITVHCNWGGWEKIQKHQFRPVVGD